MSKTEQARQYIRKQIENAFDEDRKSIDINVKDVHSSQGWKNRYPIACIAMLSLMDEGDLIIEGGEVNNSGTIQNTRLTVRYFIHNHH